MTAAHDRIQLIGLCGYAGSGKDEAAKALVNIGWHRVAFADAVRDALLALDPWVKVTTATVRLSLIVEMDGWNGAKAYPEVRRLLQRLGTEAGRGIHGQDCWVAIGERKIGDHLFDPVVFTDVRFENEAYMIQRNGGFIYRVVRPGVGPANEHVSEQQQFTVDGEIVNDGTIEQLHAKVLALVGHAEVYRA